MRLDAIVRTRFGVSWGKARGWIESGKIWHDGRPLLDGAQLTESDFPLELKMNAPRPKKSEPTTDGEKKAPALEVIYVDTQVIVVNKPAGLNTVPFADEKFDTLQSQVSRHLKQPRVEVVQRLDRETSGLVVFARHSEAAKNLSNQFRFHHVERRYFALAEGSVRTQTIRSALLPNRGDGLRGSWRPGSGLSRDLAKDAVTHIERLAQFDTFTLVECRLETGRTHQIRIHLSEAGHPLLGERAYNREFKTSPTPASRLMLHAAELGFVHPQKNVPMRWIYMPPPDFLSHLDPATIGILKSRR